MQNRKRALAAILAVVAIVVTVVLATGADIVEAINPADNETPITGAALEQASAAALAHTGEGTVTDTEVGDEDGFYEVEVTLADGSEVDVHLDEQFNVIGDEAESGDEDENEEEDGDEVEDEAEGADVAITGEALEKATAAALAHTGEGTVTGTEVGDEDGFYEVEVTLADGSQVDVHLDEQFNVIGQKADEADQD